ncbi:WecB/TagA/CpsF family glycosyltransferase [Brevundimonas sp. TWP2-3-4b1]|uniref:WecB/TagA/CpsF family glycosyltransferase n=1 Tax=Brevundimonas sp. TWP2-3-4b1 TaxID=2804580 RepID=UPI003CF97D25
MPKLIPTTSKDAAAASTGLDYVLIAGAPISDVTMDTAVERLKSWVSSKGSKYICVADVHSVMRARRDPSHEMALRNADMVTPDGQPLSWVSALLGRPAMRRVCGPDLMLRLIDDGRDLGWRHFLYGGTEDVVRNLKVRLESLYPGVHIVGAYSPPFRDLTPAEDDQVVQMIRRTTPNIVWVGLGCPKQERWAMTHSERLPRTVLIGVGAAFDFHAGAIARAPRVFQRLGVEWLHRLVHSPRRLWRRYLIDAPQFVMISAAEIFKRNTLKFTAISQGRDSSEQSAQ